MISRNRPAAKPNKQRYENNHAKGFEGSHLLMPGVPPPSLQIWLIKFQIPPKPIQMVHDHATGNAEQLDVFALQNIATAQSSLI